MKKGGVRGLEVTGSEGGRRGALCLYSYAEASVMLVITIMRCSHDYDEHSGPFIYDSSNAKLSLVEFFCYCQGHSKVSYSLNGVNC